MSGSAISTATPAARKRCMPAPLTAGKGSSAPTTTRPTWASIKASQHGAVLPWWAQGSRVTHAVAPCKSCPRCIAWRSAITSACGPPASCVAPEPSTVPSWRPRMQPTRGLGSVRPKAPSANASACCSRSRSNWGVVIASADVQSTRLVLIGGGVDQVPGHVAGAGIGNRRSIACHGHQKVLVRQ